jgi:putative exosortase-associated protein (TIGR04073 family)
MQKTLALLGAVVVTGLLATGCAGPERKLGRGLNNVYEIVRAGEMRRSVEQSALFDPGERYTTGMVRGFSRTMARTGIGIYEVVTFPIPSYDPVATRHFKPNPVFPDSYKPRLAASSLFATDTSIGFSGGDVAPWAPGSRFHIFDN